MSPFKVYDKKEKTTWVVLNYHPSSDASKSGSYLVFREDDSDLDGEMKIMPAEKFQKFRMLEFVVENE